MLVPNGLFVTRTDDGYYVVDHVPSGKRLVLHSFGAYESAISYAQSLDEVGVDWWGTTNHLEKNTRVAECVEGGIT